MTRCEQNPWQALFLYPKPKERRESVIGSWATQPMVEEEEGKEVKGKCWYNLIRYNRVFTPETVFGSHFALWPGSVFWLIRILRNTTNGKRSFACIHFPLVIRFGYKIHGTGAGSDHCSKSLLCRTPNYPTSLTMPPQPSGKAVKKAGKAQKAVRASDKKKKRRRRKESFSIYIYKVSCIKNWPKCIKYSNQLYLLYQSRSWNRCTQTLVSPPRPCPSWTPSWMTSSSESLPKPPDWPTTTRGQPSPLGKSKPLSDSCCPENWPNMPSLKEPRPSPSTPAPNKLLVTLVDITNTSSSMVAVWTIIQRPF